MELADCLFLGRILKANLEMHSECALNIHVQTTYYFPGHFENWTWMLSWFNSDVNAGYIRRRTLHRLAKPADIICFIICIWILGYCLTKSHWSKYSCLTKSQWMPSVYAIVGQPSYNHNLVNLLQNNRWVHHYLPSFV